MIDLEAWELMDGFLRHQTPTDPEVVAPAADLVYAPLVIGEQSSAGGEELGSLVRLGGAAALVHLDAELIIWSRTSAAGP